MKRTLGSILVWVYWSFWFCLSLITISILFVITWPFDQYRKIPNNVLNLLAHISLRSIPNWQFIIETDGISKIDKPTIIVANHQSFLDIPLLYLLPWNMKWVTKRGMRKIPVLGWMITMTGHIPIDRHSFRSFQALNRLVEPVRNGIPGMIFPEGTRSKDGNVQAFKRGAFKLAKKYNFRVLPVVVSGGFHAMPPGSWKFRFHNEFTASVLAPVQSSEFESESELLDHVHELIQHELANIQSENDS